MTSSTKEFICMDQHRRGLIWISGYSAAGKTTVGRKVEAKLKARDIPAIFLDGDDLRSIFGAKWGYDRAERIDLAKVYFRMASHIAAQGFTVVLSAVAMYDEVRQWVRDNVPHSIQIYLNVPIEERIQRDSQTKKVYDQIGATTPDYDFPDDLTIPLDNFGDGMTPDIVADRIIEAYVQNVSAKTDYGRNRHWGAFYANRVASVDPSPFALSVNEAIDPPARLLEIGCGNGRDALYFASQGHDVTAIDMSPEAIEACRSHASPARFLAGTAADLRDELDRDYDVVYSRFVIHAMPQVEEELLLDRVAALLKPGGRFFVECRSINDPMARMGEVISPTERIYGHYRRFIVPDEFLERVRARGFKIVRHQEANGLAVHGDEDPTVIRTVAEKE